MANWNPVERYKRLGIRESLPREHRYPTACKDLSFILRGAYDRLPKHLKSVVFDDTVAAFRLLPECSDRFGHYRVSYALSDKKEMIRMENGVITNEYRHFLMAAEAALPKQKKNSAVMEFKRAKIAYKKQCKMRQESSDSVQLPQDVLLHVFSFLDVQSILSASLVCWSWNVATNDNSVWQSQCMRMFVAGANDKMEHKQDQLHGLIQKNKEHEALNDWKEIFKRMCIGNTHKRFTSNRGYCRQCKSIVWVNNLACSNPHIGSKSTSSNIKPISQQRVVDYILCDSSSDSDSDSDSDAYGQPSVCDNDDSSWEQVSRLWAYPKFSPC